MVKTSPKPKRFLNSIVRDSVNHFEAAAMNSVVKASIRLFENAISEQNGKLEKNSKVMDAVKQWENAQSGVVKARFK